MDNESMGLNDLNGCRIQGNTNKTTLSTQVFNIQHSSNECHSCRKDAVIHKAPESWPDH
jgi:hypothetical protein